MRRQNQWHVYDFGLVIGSRSSANISGVRGRILRAERAEKYFVCNIRHLLVITAPCLASVRRFVSRFYDPIRGILRPDLCSKRCLELSPDAPPSPINTPVPAVIVTVGWTWDRTQRRDLIKIPTLAGRRCRCQPRYIADVGRWCWRRAVKHQITSHLLDGIQLQPVVLCRGYVWNKMISAAEGVPKIISKLFRRQWTWRKY